MKKNMLIGVLVTVLIGCGSPQESADSTSPVEDAQQVEAIGTSPFTNCNFDASSSGETFDTVILNGRVMDPECNFDATRNVGISEGEIVRITTDVISCERTIDANGLVVAPGFINTHSHSFAPFEQRMMAHDGTTTILDTELGVANAGLFYERYSDNSLLNYGSGISHEEVRKVVLDGVPIEEASDSTFALKSRAIAQEDGYAQWALDIPTPEQHRSILTYYEQGIRDGAISVNSTIGYMGFGVPTSELFDLQKLAKKYDRIFGAHTRFGVTEDLPIDYTLGVREVVANAVAIDGALILSHINNQGWDETYELCRRLQERGMTIFCEYYIVGGTLVVDDGESQLGLRPGQAIRYEPITDGEIVLDYNDNQYQWHADLPNISSLR